MSSTHRRLASLASLALAASGLSCVAGAFTPAHANPAGTGLVISEVYGGGGNSGAPLTNDFVELYNPTSTPVSLAGKGLEYKSAAGGSAGVLPLSGTVPANGYFLIQLAAGSASPAPLPAPDLTGSLNLSGTAGRVYLLPSTTAFPATTGDVAGDAGLIDMVGFGSTAATFEAAPAPAPSNSTSVARAGGADNDNNAGDFAAGAPTPRNSGVVPPEEPEEPVDPVQKTIVEIQGAGATSPLAGTLVSTEGVVTAAYPSGGFYGFYLQTPGSGGAVDLATHTTSQAIFVRQRSGAITVRPGDHVRVTGTVSEYAGQTQVEIAGAAEAVTLDAPAAPVTAVVSAWPATAAQKESLEGMLFDPQGEFTVSNTYGTERYAELGLAQGDTPLLQPTEVALPGSAEAAAVAADNAARAIVLDDGSSTDFTSRKDLTPPYISNEVPVVVGASVELEDVILTQGGSPSAPSYRFQPLATATADPATWPATFEDIRTDAPDAEKLGDADLKVASFNVLNYFTTLGDADNDNVGDGGCVAYRDRDGDGNNVDDGCDQRGAWDPEDFERQQEKIVAAINALDADVVGLMEIENSLTLGEEADEATESLVAALNAAAGSQVWAANPSSADLPDGGMDVITNAIIYKPAAVDRVGASLALGDLSDDGEAFGNAREPLGQVFAPKGGGEPFLFVVNHFKSKGSAGPWPGDADSGDGQGSSNESRERQSTALRDWVAVQQAAAGVDDVFLVGDFNSYTMEDPLQILYAAGYEDSELASGHDEYSYSFSGLSGSLDHILLNEGALERMTGTDIWNINSGESLLMEYSRWNYTGTDFHDAGPFRSSDHDPVIVGLRKGAVPTPVDPPIVVTPEPGVSISIPADAVGSKKPVQVQVVVDGAPANGKLKVRAGKRTVVIRAVDGVATLNAQQLQALLEAADEHSRKNGKK